MRLQKLPSAPESKCMHPSGGHSVHLRLWMKTGKASPGQRPSSQFIQSHQRQAGNGSKGCPQRIPLLNLQHPSPSRPVFTPGQTLRREAGFDLKQNKPQASRFTDQGSLASPRILVETNFSLGVCGGGGRNRALSEPKSRKSQREDQEGRAFCGVAGSGWPVLSWC